ncbi:hypothetical protein Y032_0024g1010 [Ancylostoma ceylanicum]|uniref:Uncharacterized protein n=1 Tax=Ancylostoma ceylanicum TaxID=53326 RepID=A0A016UXV0_9BILA|nr:hypothetical protein Y032_0024g1010 [Ancylostoma ceylanicum]
MFICFRDMSAGRNTHVNGQRVLAHTDAGCLGAADSRGHLEGIWETAAEASEFDQDIVFANKVVLVFIFVFILC